jgi:hypothetical protein
MITTSGPICDVCGTYIIFDKSINPFKITGIESTLCCHDKCRTFIEDNLDWRKLPNGPLRKTFEMVEELEAENNIINENK